MRIITIVKVLLGMATFALSQSANAQPSIPTATEFGAKLLGTPCHVVNAIGNKLLVQPPGLDHQILVINSDTPGEVGSAIFVDYHRGTSTIVPMPSGSGGWDVIEIAPGKLLFESISEPLTLVTMDITNGDYKVESTVEVPGNQYAWQFAKGADGKIYMGSYPTAHLYSYDPSTKKVEDLGKIGPDKNLYLRFLAFDAKSGLLICVSGMNQSQVVAYNVNTKKKTVIANVYPTEMHSIYGRVYAAISKVLCVFDSAQMKMIPVTSPAPPPGTTWTSMALSSTPGQALWETSDDRWYSIDEQGKSTPVWKDDLKGGGLMAIDANEQLLGMRGQDYFVSKSLGKIMNLHPIATEPTPVSIHFLAADPKGGVTGGPSFGQTLFRFDPARQLAQNTGQVADGGGEVYGGLWRDNKFYYAAYSGGYLGVWDPAQPWDQWNNINPKILRKYSLGKYDDVTTHFGLIRPIGGIVEGPGKKLYIGWSAAYGKAGGGLTEYDPATNKSRGWTNERFAKDMSIGKIAADDQYVYGVTSNLFSGIKLPNKLPVFWVFDPASEKVLFKKELNGVVFNVPTTHKIWFATAQGVQQFDPQKMNFNPVIPWPSGTTIKRGISNATTHGSTAWIAVDDTVMKLQDGAEPKLSALFQVKERPLLAAGDDGNLYFAQGSQLWSVPMGS